MTSCVNHPYRESYGTCSICMENFCYADLVKRGKSYYCLRDAGTVKLGPESSMKGTIGLNFVGALIIVNAICFGLLIYPYALFTMNYISSFGLNSLMSDLSQSYVMFYANLVIVLLGFFAGAALLLSKSNSTSKFSKIILVVTLLALGYQYYATASTYIFALMLIEMLAAALLLYFRMSISLEGYESEMYGNGLHHSHIKAMQEY